MVCSVAKDDFWTFFPQVEMEKNRKNYQQDYISCQKIPDVMLL